tara:strand:+ start:790 stop:1458 length:669 start_codon:yes stop_codon:yes gene_type:complete
MKRRTMSLKDKIDTFNLSFDTTEFKQSLEDNLVNFSGSSVYSNGKRAWFKEDKPLVIKQIDAQLRKRYKIGEENKMVACVYYPPEKDDQGKFLEKTTQIKENRDNVLHRFIISTCHDICDASFGKIRSEPLELRQWVSNKIPDMIGGMLSYEFKNDKNLVIPARKGFRQVRKTKNTENRYLIVLDYIISTKQYEELTNMLSNKEETVEDDDRIEDALEELRI